MTNVHEDPINRMIPMTHARFALFNVVQRAKFCAPLYAIIATLLWSHLFLIYRYTWLSDSWAITFVVIAAGYTSISAVKEYLAYHAIVTGQLYRALRIAELERLAKAGEW